MARGRPLQLTIIHPCVGRRAGDRRYIRTWQMEPLSAAVLAGLTPQDVQNRFFDDRLEPIPYDAPADLVAISVETYTARRAYQIASEYRKRRVPVVMGGFHATLCPEEVSRYADVIVIGEAEEVWTELIDDCRANQLQKTYRAPQRPCLGRCQPNRNIFAGKRYLPIRLLEAGRGCRYQCEFCAVQTALPGGRYCRPLDRILAEIEQIRRPRQLLFFVDDNISANLASAKELLRTLIPLRVRWVSQSSVDAAFDEEYLDLLRQSGCQGLLVGFESLEASNLQQMNKTPNTSRDGLSRALEAFRRHNLRIYGTFIFGYDSDTPRCFDEAVAFAQDQGLFIAAFNHITPFPGTGLYQRLSQEGRLMHDAWWLDPAYRYNAVPFRPRQMTAEELQRRCLDARRRFYSWPSIVQRGIRKVNRSDWFMAANFLAMNAMHRWDTHSRNGLPLGDERCTDPLIPVQ